MIGNDNNLLQIDISCTDDQISKEHRCAVRELINALETLPVSAVVRSSLKLNLDKTASYNVDTNLPGADSESRAIVSDSQEPDGGPLISSNVSVCNRLARWHYLVAILLFWPYVAGIGTLGHVLHRFMTEQLELTDSQLLRNEIFLLKKQMSLVLSFVKKCEAATSYNCPCSGNNK